MQAFRNSGSKHEYRQTGFWINNSSFVKHPDSNELTYVYLYTMEIHPIKLDWKPLRHRGLYPKVAKMHRVE